MIVLLYHTFCQNSAIFPSTYLLFVFFIYLLLLKLIHYSDNWQILRNKDPYRGSQDKEESQDTQKGIRTHRREQGHIEGRWEPRHKEVRTYRRESEHTREPGHTGAMTNIREPWHTEGSKLPINEWTWINSVIWLMVFIITSFITDFPTMLHHNYKTYWWEEKPDSYN